VTRQAEDRARRREEIIDVAYAYSRSPEDWPLSVVRQQDGPSVAKLVGRLRELPAFDRLSPTRETVEREYAKLYPPRRRGSLSVQRRLEETPP
jgi:hypothetical protein